MQATINLLTPSAPRPSYRSISRCTTQELLDRSQAGGIEARHELVGRYRSVIQATASRMAANRNDADDLAAEIYIHVFNVVNSCRNVQTLPSWIKRIAINEFYQKCRRARRHVPQTSLELMVEVGGDAVLPVNESENPATILMERFVTEERQERVQKALQSLPKHHRDLCEMYYVKQIPFEQITQETGIAIGTIKSRLFRARESMKRKLSDLIVA